MNATTEKINRIKKSAKATNKPLKQINKEEVTISVQATDLNEILKLSKRIKNFQSMYEKITGEKPNNKDVSLSVFYENILMDDLKKYDTDIKSQNGLYYIWTGKYWKSLEKDTLKRFIKQYIKKRGMILHTNSNVVDGVFKNISISKGGIVYKVNENTQLLNLNNGVLFISPKEIEFKTHNKKYNLNYCLDFNYDKNSENTLWQNFLDDTLPNRQTQRTFQQVIGNLLIKGLKIEVLPFLYGTGGNGKSVVLEVIKGLFGDDNVSSYNLTSITTNEKVRASISDGKLMNLASENDMSHINVEVAKAYSSGEDLECRLNYGNPFTTNKYAKFLGNVNKLTLMDGDRTEALRRRQIIIPFRKKIREDKNLKLDINIHHKILQNKSGVLNWILTGMYEVFKNEKIFKSDEVVKLLNRYDEDTNPIKQMIKEKGIRIIADNSKTPKSDFMTLKNIYRIYQEFLTEIGGGKLSRSNFKTDLLSIDGINEFSHNNVICFNVTMNFEPIYNKPKPPYEEPNLINQ